MADIPSEHMDKASELVAKAWSDESFKKRLMKDPMPVLKEHGFPLPPPGVEVRVVENTDKVRYLLLPNRPSSGQLKDADLDGVAGGLAWGSTLSLRQFETLKRAAVGAFAERAVCALWSPARIL
jgi:hypothetical protein